LIQANQSALAIKDSEKELEFIAEGVEE